MPRLVELLGKADADATHLFAVLRQDSKSESHVHVGDVHAPDADIALSSIAQDELGHARLLYDHAGTLLSQSPDELAFGRQPAAFRNAILVERPIATGAIPSCGCSSTTSQTRCV